MIAPLELLRTQNSELRQVQDSVASVLRDVTSRSILDGRLLEDIVLEEGVVATIPHKLGRKLLGWILVRKDANEDVWDSQASNPTPTRTLVLNNTLTAPGATMTISLWVF